MLGRAEELTAATPIKTISTANSKTALEEDVAILRRRFFLLAVFSLGIATRCVSCLWSCFSRLMTRH